MVEEKGESEIATNCRCHQQIGPILRLPRSHNAVGNKKAAGDDDEHSTLGAQRRWRNDACWCTRSSWVRCLSSPAAIELTHVQAPTVQ